MNPNAKQKTSIFFLLLSYYKNYDLIYQMTKRQVIGRYKGSLLGIGWSFLNPLLMLCVFTFVFSIVFNAKWGVSIGGEEESKGLFAIVLFIGMIVHGVLAEILNNAPLLIVNNTNYVKKVVFPLEILPIVSAQAALFHMIISIVVWIIAYVVLIGPPSIKFLFLPFVIFPLLILSLGLSYFIAALGVYLRDVSQTMGVITTVLLFLSTVFFPIDRLPEQFKSLIMANPITFIIEQSREVLIWSGDPDVIGLSIYLFISTIVLWLGFCFFQKVKKGFADVL